jgi:hypothetical protein
MTIGNDKIPDEAQSPICLPGSIRHCARANHYNHLVMRFTKRTSTVEKATE